MIDQHTRAADSPSAGASSLAETLNADCHSVQLDRAALQRTMQAQGDAWHALVTERCPHLFADVPVFITAAQMQLMHDVVDAVHRVVALDGWQAASQALTLAQQNESVNHKAKSAFFGYDFHFDEQGAHLIEINTNAGGGFLAALLLDSQSGSNLPGAAVAEENLAQAFPDMFRNEWQLERGDAPLNNIVIVDDQPEAQYLYPEFLLAKNLFERAGITTFIAAPADLQLRDDGVYLAGQKIDLIYNRLTDFYLQHHPALYQAYLDGQVVMSPHPQAYAQYADKRNLALLTDADALRASGAQEADIATLQAGIPRTIIVQPGMEEQLWAERKQLFFKPNSGYGSKGAYRGEKLTKRVFAEILQGDYVAQKLAPPGERALCLNNAEAAPLKYDVRCFVYDGKIQLVSARLYQGQTTNFRTPGGGFALVRVLS